MDTSEWNIGYKYTKCGIPIHLVWAVSKPGIGYKFTKYGVEVHWVRVASTTTPPGICHIIFHYYNTFALLKTKYVFHKDNQDRK